MEDIEHIIRTPCLEKKIIGAFQEGRGWKILIDTVNPLDGRLKKQKAYYRLLKKK